MARYIQAVKSCVQILVGFFLIDVTIWVMDEFSNYHIFQQKDDIYINNLGEQLKEISRGEYFSYSHIFKTNLT